MISSPRRKGYILYLVIIVTAAALSFFKSVFFAKYLSAEDFGVYSLVLTSYAFLIYLGSFGASEYMLKLGSREFAKGNTASLLRLRTNALYYGFLTTALLSILAVFIASVLFESRLNILILSAQIAVPAICYNVFDAYYRSSRKHLWFSSMLLAKASLILLIAFFSIQQFGLNAAIGAEVAAFVIVFFVIFFFNFSSFKVADINSFRDELSLMSKHGLPTIMVNMTRNVSLMFERYFISFALGFIALGEYSFVMIIYQTSIMSGGILINILGPEWLAFHAKHLSQSLLLKKIGQFSLALVGLSLLVYPIFYFGLPPVLGKYFEKYNTQEVILMTHLVYWTSVSYLVISFMDWFFIAISKERITLLISVVSLVLLIVLFGSCYYYKLGIVYYAMSFLVSRVVAVLLMLLAALRQIKAPANSAK